MPKIDFERNMTFMAEGDHVNRRSPYFCHRLHHPGGDASGVTLGAGFDLGNRKYSDVFEILKRAGVGADDAKVVASLASLKGEKRCKDAIKGMGLSEWEISEGQCKEIFTFCYSEAYEDVKRICQKPDVVAKFGKVDLDSLSDGLKSWLIDLRFRGDFSGDWRADCYKWVVCSDIAGLLAATQKYKDTWPRERFNMRVKALSEMIH